MSCFTSDDFRLASPLGESKKLVLTALVPEPYAPALAMSAMFAEEREAMAALVQQNHRLRKVLAACAGSILIILILFIVLFSLHCDRRPGTDPFTSQAVRGDNVTPPDDPNRLVSSGITFWRKEYRGETKGLATVPGISRHSMSRIKEQFGHLCVVSVNGTATLYDFFTEEPTNVSGGENLFGKCAVYFDKKCQEPATLEDDYCTWYSEDKASWWEAYAKCDMLGMRLATTAWL